MRGDEAMYSRKPLPVFVNRIDWKDPLRRIVLPTHEEVLIAPYYFRLCWTPAGWKVDGVFANGRLDEMDTKRMHRLMPIWFAMVLAAVVLGPIMVLLVRIAMRRTYRAGPNS